MPAQMIYVHAALFFVHKSNVVMLTFSFMPMLIS